MNGPSNEWLQPFQALVNQPAPPTVAPGVAPAPPPTIVPEQAANAADPFAAGAAGAGIAPAPQDPSQGPPVTITGVSAAPPATLGLNPNAAAPAPIAPPAPNTLTPQGPPGPPPPPAGPAPPPGAPMGPPPAPEPDVSFRQISGGGITPAHEAVTRGPKANALLDRSFEHPIDAAMLGGARAEQTASHEASVYDSLAEEAINRQQALERVAQRRAAEQIQMRADYDKTIQQLAQTKLDNNRAWANTSTLGKIGAIALIFLGGVASGGGENKVKTAIDKNIADDVNAQKFDYQKGLDLAKAQQTAFGLAMNQYDSEDAAYHASLAAAQQATAMKLGSLAAEWKGTDAGNRAQEMAAHYMMLADQNAASGFKFVPAAQQAPKFQLSIRGQALPAPVSGDKANELVAKYGIEPGIKTDEELVKGGIQSTIEAQKERAAASKGKKITEVRLPSGEVVEAPSEAEAGKLRELVTSTDNTKRLVAEARQIRTSSVFRGSPRARARLEQIQSELLTDFGVQHQLGALSDKDYDIAKSGTANLFDFGSPVEARLDRLNEQASAKLTSRVRTYPGASDRAQGKMPGSFEPVK